MTDKQLEPYINNLQETLMKGSITSRKGFIRSFIKKISVNDLTLEVEYTTPLPIDEKLEKSEVRCIGQVGVPYES